MILEIERHDMDLHKKRMQERIQAYYLHLLKDEVKFSREELLDAMQKDGREVGEAAFKANLQKLLKYGEILRVGRNAYCVANNGLRSYTYEHSERAENTAECINERFPFLDFRIMEYVQLNEFVNHQFAHNVVFVSVEGDLASFVFDVLKERNPGKVLINPTPEIYHQYWCDDMFVVDKLVSEAPVGQGERWDTRIEKLLVDVFANPILQSTVSKAELPNIYEGAFEKYAIDESCMFRYAKRRGADIKIREFIKEKTKIQLRLGG